MSTVDSLVTALLACSDRAAAAEVIREYKMDESSSEETLLEALDTTCRKTLLHLQFEQTALFRFVGYLGQAFRKSEPEETPPPLVAHPPAALVLFYAVRGSFPEHVRALIGMDKGALAQDSKQEHFLHLACEKGNVDIVRQLLDWGGLGQLEEQNQFGLLPIHSACVAGHAEVVALLIEMGGPLQIHIRTRGGFFPILLACRRGQREVVETLLEGGGHEQLQFRDESQDLPIHVASNNGHIDVLRLLVEVGGPQQLEEKGHADEYPLFRSCKQGDLDVIRAILELGGSSQLKLQNSAGDCAIHVASGKRHNDLFKTLRKAGGDEQLSYANAHGALPLHIAAEKGRPAIVKQLLSVVALESCLKKDSKLEIALLKALRGGHIRIMQQILGALRPSPQWTELQSYLLFPRVLEQISNICATTKGDDTKRGIALLISTEAMSMETIEATLTPEIMETIRPHLSTTAPPSSVENPSP